MHIYRSTFVILCMVCTGRSSEIGRSIDDKVTFIFSCIVGCIESFGREICRKSLLLPRGKRAGM